jgi:hypothetical protein
MSNLIGNNKRNLKGKLKGNIIMLEVQEIKYERIFMALTTVDRL